MIGADLVAGAATTPTDCAPSPSAPVTGASSPRAGWNVYDAQAYDPVHMAALRRQRPSVLRWICSWDRHHLHPYGHNGDGIPAPPDWLNGPYREFFDELRPSAANPRGTTLVVQILCKNHLFWTGDGWPATAPGTSWALGHRYSGALWPERYGIGPTYGAFVRSLQQAFAAIGVDAQFGAWNEADLRTSLGTRFGAENFLEPWTVNPFDVFRGVPYFGWSGGAGALWQELHQQLPGSTLNTSGILHDGWRTRTAQFPEVGTLDLHCYWGHLEVGAFVRQVEESVSAWDAAAPHLPKRKVLIGECAPMAPLAHDIAGAAWLWQRHEALSQANENTASPLFGRYTGMCAHTGGGGAAMAWEIDQADPAALWWQYNPGYDAHATT